MTATAEVRQDDTPTTLTFVQKAAKGHASRKAEGRRERCKNAVFVEQFTMEALKQMRECLSFTDPESARDNALALGSAVKSWDTAQERIRVLKGEPQPGQKRPLPEVKKEKAKKLNRPPPSLAPAKVVPDPAAQAAGTPQEPT